MKTLSAFLYNILLLLIIVGLFHCTRNPIENDNKIINSSTIKGKVILSDSATPYNVLIWLQDSDAIAKTDESGFFELQIPSVTTQSGGGLNGIFQLYFYMGNYYLDSVEVLLQDGLVTCDYGHVDKSGILREPIILSNYLEIISSISTDTITVNYVGDIIATFELRSVFNQNSPVVSIPYIGSPNTITKCIVDKTDGDPFFPIITEHPILKGTYNTEYDLTISNQQINILLSWPPIQDRVFRTYLPGIYKIYLYFNVQNVTLPPVIAEYIEPFINFGPEYVNAPVSNNYVTFCIE